MWKRIETELENLKQNHLYRQMTVIDSPQRKNIEIDGKKYLLFASNSYLDLCDDAYVKTAAQRAMEEYGIGAGGSRLTTGTTTCHKILEETIAQWKHREAALAYNAGYIANLGIITALVKAGDIIFSDELNHASIIDGARLSKAQIVVYKHNDMLDLENKIKEHAGCQGLIVSDGVFSMDGDVVDLPGLVALARKYQLLSMIDEAHSTGVLGKTGNGVEEYYDMIGSVDVLMGTLSKSVGVEGGFVCGSKMLIEYLINKSRSFIFSTAFSPVMAAAATAGIERIRTDENLVKRLQENISYFCKKLQMAGLDIHSDSAIIPIIVGDEEVALQAMADLKDRGYYISAIRYPTVGKGSARLRIALMSSHTKEELDGLVEALVECLGRKVINE